MARPRGSGLTDRQKLFAHEYLKDLNATQAAIRAGYSPRSARELGCRLLTDPEILRLTASAQEARANRLDINTDRIEQELARIAFFDIETDAAAKVKVTEKLRALELLGKRHGMFVEKVEMKKDDLPEEEMADRARALIEKGLARKAAAHE